MHSRQKLSDSLSDALDSKGHLQGGRGAWLALPFHYAIGYSAIDIELFCFAQTIATSTKKLRERNPCNCLIYNKNIDKYCNTIRNTIDNTTIPESVI